MSILDLFDPSKHVHPKTRRERVNICMECEHLFRLTKNCKKCTCFVREKAKLITEDCPMGFWRKL